MISFNYLGNMGRLGNQLFQYASLKGIAKKRGYDFIIPPKKVFGSIDFNVRNSNSSIYDCFDLPDFNVGITNYTGLSESTFGFDENIYNNCPDNVDLVGYFQTEKYFKHIEHEIRKDLKFKQNIFETSKDIFEKMFPNKHVISLHIRRGDYLSNANYSILGNNYYENALNYFDSDIPVIVFSDDPVWCKEQDIFQSDRFFISEGGDTAIDLCLMSMCSYHIIANSSYSWWGSYLSKSKKTIAPKNWFEGDLKITHTLKDLYLEEWTIL